MDKYFKYWIDAEFTILHILCYVIIGIQLSTTIGWLVCGTLIFVSVVYTSIRVAALPKDYLKVRK